MACNPECSGPCCNAAHPDNTRKQYVVGFLFMPDIPSRHNPYQGWEVALIRKNRPDWQRGLLNGIGGKVEGSEIPREAMIREFREEAGLYITEWHPVVDMVFPDCTVHVFQARLGESVTLLSLTDEKVEVWNVGDVLKYSHKVPNLHWLIPMALFISPPVHAPRIIYDN